jgi:transcriptional regulator with XRE-family HTH domain
VALTMDERECADGGGVYSAGASDPLPQAQGTGRSSRSRTTVLASEPSPRRRLVGAAMRRYREEAGLELDDAARILDCDRSKISRIETGERGIRLAELGMLLAEYGADAAGQDALAAIAQPSGNAWWKRYAHVLPPALQDALSVEAAAAGMLVYSPAQVPDLMHTPQYARAAAVADAGVPEGAEDTVVAAVLARQRTTLHERRIAVTVVLGEGALLQRVGGTPVLRAQLRHLVTMAARSPQVTIRVLPFGAGAQPTGCAGGFSVLEFGPVPALGLVHVAGPAGGICLDAPDTVAAYARAFDRLRLLSLSPQDSVRKLWKIADG